MGTIWCFEEKNDWDLKDDALHSPTVCPHLVEDYPGRAAMWPLVPWLEKDLPYITRGNILPKFTSRCDVHGLESGCLSISQISHASFLWPNQLQLLSFLHPNTHTRAHTHTHTHTHAHTQHTHTTHTHAHTHNTHTCTCTHTHTHAHTCTCTHTHTHAHTFISFWLYLLILLIQTPPPFPSHLFNSFFKFMHSVLGTFPWSDRERWWHPCHMDKNRSSADTLPCLKAPQTFTDAQAAALWGSRLFNLVQCFNRNKLLWGDYFNDRVRSQISTSSKTFITIHYPKWPQPSSTED